MCRSFGVMVCPVLFLCLLQYRWNILRNIRNAIDQNEGGLQKFSQGALFDPCCDQCLTGV
jgi:hypothetical protein